MGARSIALPGTTNAALFTGCARTNAWLGTATMAPGTERFTYRYVVTLMVHTFVTVTWLMLTLRT